MESQVARAAPAKMSLFVGSECLLYLVALLLVILNLPGPLCAQGCPAGSTPRPYWKCPNGNSFEQCQHSCKCVHYKNGKVDRETELACGEQIATHSTHLRAAYDYMSSIYGSCGSEAIVVADRTPCNFIAARLLKNIWGYDDFQPFGSPMSAKAINDYLMTKSPIIGMNGINWIQVAPDDAILSANRGDPVFASSPHHIALVIPGGYVFSPSWGENEPEVIALSKDDVANGKPPLRCMPCEAANTFLPDKPRYFVRIPLADTYIPPASFPH